jgi:hypothetical protein
MSGRIAELAARRELLVARSSLQRLQVQFQLRELRRPFSFLEQGAAVVRYVRGHPAIFFGAALAIGLLRPRRALKWAMDGARLWLLLRKV